MIIFSYLLLILFILVLIYGVLDKFGVFERERQAAIKKRDDEMYESLEKEIAERKARRNR